MALLRSTIRKAIYLDGPMDRTYPLANDPVVCSPLGVDNRAGQLLSALQCSIRLQWTGGRQQGC